MSPLILTALVSVIVASLSGFVSSYITISVERRKLKIDLKKAYAIELFKKRLESYPSIWTMLGGLSAQAVKPLDAARATEIARQLNDWLYSIGGLCADMEARRAVLDVRNACLELNEGKSSVEEIRELRDVAMIYLRRDLDLKGLESFNTDLSVKGDELIAHT